MSECPSRHPELAGSPKPAGEEDFELFFLDAWSYLFENYRQFANESREWSLESPKLTPHQLSLCGFDGWDVGVLAFKPEDYNPDLQKIVRSIVLCLERFVEHGESGRIVAERKQLHFDELYEPGLRPRYFYRPEFTQVHADTGEPVPVEGDPVRLFQELPEDERMLQQVESLTSHEMSMMRRLLRIID